MDPSSPIFLFFFFNDTATTEIYTLSLHDALPISVNVRGQRPMKRPPDAPTVHDFEPKTFWSTFSGATPPALHVFPGDTIRTKTVDAYGRDERDEIGRASCRERV